MERYDLMGTPTASSEEAGVLRIASEVDEKNCGCVDAAITPSNLYNLLGCRKANTAYVGNEVVACPYHTEFLLKCVQAGSTATGSLDTTNVTSGQVITDGGVKWEVMSLLDMFLPLAGGVMTGTIIANVANIIRGLNNASAISIYGGSNASNGAYMRLLGNAVGNQYGYDGGFAIYTKDENGNGNTLLGLPDGTFKWGGKDIAIVESIKLSNSGYIQFTNGLVLAWAKLVNSGNPYTATKPIPFTTYVAITVDRMASGGERLSQAWLYEQTTDTTDTFQRKDASDAFSVFWVGKAV